MTGYQSDKGRLLAEARGIESAAVCRELTPTEATRLDAIYRQIDEIDADAEANAGWVGN